MPEKDPVPHFSLPLRPFTTDSVWITLTHKSSHSIVKLRSLDLDECFSHPHGCQHACNNHKGGFFCSCHAGYRLNTDKKTCDGKSDLQF